MTMLQFIIGCLTVYAIIHLHRKHGFKWLVKEAVLGIVISSITVFILWILFFK